MLGQLGAGGVGHTAVGGGIGHLDRDVLRVGGHGVDQLRHLGVRVVGDRRGGAGGSGGLGDGLRGLVGLGDLAGRRVLVVLTGQRVIVDDRVEQRPDVLAARLLVAVRVGEPGGRHGHERDASGGHALQGLSEVDEVLGLDVVDVGVADEHVHHIVQLVEAEEGVGGDHRAQQRGQEQLLAFDAAVVAVAFGGDLPGPHVVERAVAVKPLMAGGGQHRPEFVVLQWGGAADVDPAQGVDHFGEAVEVHRHEPVDRQPGDLLNGLDQALGPAEGVGRVELGLGVAPLVAPLAGVLVVHRTVVAGLGVPGLTAHRGDGQVARERHRHHALAVRRDVHQHHGVRSGPFGVGRVTGPHLGVRPDAAVHADDQEVFVTELRVRVQDVARVRVERRDVAQQVVLGGLPLVGAAGQRQRRHREERRGRTPGQDDGPPLLLFRVRRLPGLGPPDALRRHPVIGLGVPPGDQERSLAGDGRQVGNLVGDAPHDGDGFGAVLGVVAGHRFRRSVVPRRWDGRGGSPELGDQVGDGQALGVAAGSVGIGCRRGGAFPRGRRRDVWRGAGDPVVVTGIGRAGVARSGVVAVTHGASACVRPGRVGPLVEVLARLCARGRGADFWAPGPAAAARRHELLLRL